MGRRADLPAGGDAAPLTARHDAVLASWALTVIASAAPAVVAVVLTGSVPVWLPAAQGVAALGLLIAATVRPSLRPLWRFAVVMAALTILLAVATWARIHLPWLQSAFGATAFDERMQAEQTGKLLVAFAMIVLLLGLGLRRRDIFLRLGDLTAAIRPVRMLGFPRPDSWRRFGLIWGFGIAAALFVAQFILVRPGAEDFVAVLPMLPGILFYAALNAFSEEMTYRAPMLATLEPSVGPRHALWQSAVFFGIAHYFGTPGGLAGAVLSIFMGWILSKAMLETRGLFWSWFIHFLADIAIFVFIGLALVT